MRYRKLLVGGVALSLAVGGSGAAIAAGGKPPKRATIKESQTFKVKPNRYVQDGLRWKRDVYHVRSGGTLHLVNNIITEGPHTFTVVRKKDLPRTAEEVFGNCKVCREFEQLHGVDPDSDAPPQFPFVENGVGTTTPPSIDRPGDSALIGPGQSEGESLDLKVTAKNGTVLRFMCLVHPWMQAKVVVGR